MLSLDRVLNNDRLLRAMTGLNRKAFEALLPSFTEAYQQRQTKPETQRQRAPGGGRKATLRTPKDKLFYILLYCKCYPTFDLMSVLFGFDRSCAWDWVHGLLPVLEQALEYKQALPERKLRSLEKFVERVNMIAAWCNHQLMAPFTVEGACNRVVFETWLEHCLVPVLKPGQIVVMDNATFHKGGNIEALIESAGAQVWYLPPYSPDFNKIERCWSWLKSRIRHCISEFDSLREAMEHVLKMAS